MGKLGQYPTIIKRNKSRTGPRLNTKTVFLRYGDSHVKDKTVDRLVWNTRVYDTTPGGLRSIYSSLGTRQLFGDVTIRPVASQSNDLIKWPIYP